MLLVGFGHPGEPIAPLLVEQIEEALPARVRLNQVRKRNAEADRQRRPGEQGTFEWRAGDGSSTLGKADLDLQEVAPVYHDDERLTDAGTTSDDAKGQACLRATRSHKAP